MLDTMTLQPGKVGELLVGRDHVRGVTTLEDQPVGRVTKGSGSADRRKRNFSYILNCAASEKHDAVGWR